MNLTPHITLMQSTDTDRLTSIVDTAIGRLSTETLVPQGHCVDVLLDLYVATSDVGLKWLICERIDELRGRSFVLADVWHADLEAIVAIADFTHFADSISAAQLN